MARLTLLLAAVAVMAGTSGCTHCDTCDDFPTPCLDQVAGFGPAGGTFLAGDGADMPASLPATNTTTTPAPASGPTTPTTAPPPSGGSPYGAGASLEPIPGSNSRTGAPAAGVSLGGTPRRSN
jgi:hypothetical protein